MEIETILYLPGIIDRILLNSDFATVVNLILLSKGWNEILHNRATWISIGRQKDFYLSKERLVLSSAHLRILSQEHIHEPKCVPLRYESKLDSKNPREQITELNSLLNQLNDECPLLGAQITLILDANRHVVNSTHPKLPFLFLDVVLKIVERKSLPCNEILFDILKPHVLQAVSLYSESRLFYQAILEITAKALPFYRKREQLIDEFANKEVVMALVSYVVNGKYKLYRAAGDILYWILSNVDRHTNELLPLLDAIIITMKERDIIFPLEALSHSRNASIWRQVLTCFQKLQYSANWIGGALVQVCKDSPELFLEINKWDCTTQYLLEVWLSIPLQEFVSTMVVKYEDWLKIRYIQSLDQMTVDSLIKTSADDSASFNTICFIATNASADQDAVLAKIGIVPAIGCKTKSKKSVEAKLARDTIQKLMRKSKFAPLIAQELKNKTIVLY